MFSGVFLDLGRDLVDPLLAKVALSDLEKADSFYSTWRLSTTLLLYGSGKLGYLLRDW
jgi:hypothetical protein